jgi:hypothetical protein
MFVYNGLAFSVIGHLGVYLKKNLKKRALVGYNLHRALPKPGWSGASNMSKITSSQTTFPWNREGSL